MGLKNILSKILSKGIFVPELMEDFKPGTSLEEITFLDRKDERGPGEVGKVIRDYSANHKEKALEEANRLISIHNDWDVAYYWAGYILTDVGRVNEADGIINEGLKRAIEKSSLYELRAELYARGYQCPKDSLFNFPKYFLNVFKAALAETTFPYKSPGSKLLQVVHIDDELQVPNQELKIALGKINNDAFSRGIRLGKNTLTIISAGRRGMTRNLRQNIASWSDSVKRAYETRHPEYFE